MQTFHLRFQQFVSRRYFDGSLFSRAPDTCFSCISRVFARDPPSSRCQRVLCIIFFGHLSRRFLSLSTFCRDFSTCVKHSRQCKGRGRETELDRNKIVCRDWGKISRAWSIERQKRSRTWRAMLPKHRRGNNSNHFCNGTRIYCQS